MALGVAAVGHRVVRAGQELRSAEAMLDDAGAALDRGQVAEARADLLGATQALSKATASLHGHPELSVARALPVLGPNLDALREAVRLAALLSSGGADVLGAAVPLERADGSLEVPLRSGAIPLDAVQAVQAKTEALVGLLPDAADLGREDGLVLPPIRDLRRRVIDEVVERRAQARSLTDALALVADLAGGNGDRAYLIAVANSAEMRGTGGMLLSYGGLIGRAGDFELTAFGRIDDLALTEPVDRAFVPDLPDDYLRRWEGFDPLLLWRNSTMGADFTMMAPVLEAMFAARTGAQLDGVIQIDPIGLSLLLRAVGPVEVPEVGAVSSETLVPLVLNEAYVRYKGIERRSDVLREVAEAAFQKLVTGRYDSLRPLGDALVEAVRGRHLMFQSYHPDPQQRAAAFGADGSLPPLDGPDAVHLTVQNVAGNKLDYFVETELGLSGDLLPGRPGSLRAEVVVHNAAPAGVSSPRYIFGPFNSDQEVGVYRGVVSLYLPRGATLLSTSGDPPRDPPISVSEGGRPIVSWTVDLPAGASSHVVLDLRLAPRPDVAYELLAVPSPRVRSTVLRTDLETGHGRILERVVLDRSWRLLVGRAPEAVSGAVWARFG